MVPLRKEIAGIRYELLKRKPVGARLVVGLLHPLDHRVHRWVRFVEVILLILVCHPLRVQLLVLNSIKVRRKHFNEAIIEGL